jgi:hypothetical protein
MRPALIFILSLTLFCAPALARPFAYNFTLGPDYWAVFSRKADIQANIVSAGFRMRGTLFDRWNAEFRGNVGEISTTRISFNEISLLYKVANQPDRALSIGPVFVTCNNILVKASNTAIHEQRVCARLQFERGFSDLWNFYFNALALNAWGYDAGWLAYFGRRYGDFNIRVGYKMLQFDQVNVMNGMYAASSVYF